MWDETDYEQMSGWIRGPGTIAALSVQTVPWVLTESILGWMKIDVSTAPPDPRVMQNVVEKQRDLVFLVTPDFENIHIPV